MAIPGLSGRKSASAGKSTTDETKSGTYSSEFNRGPVISDQWQGQYDQMGNDIFGGGDPYGVNAASAGIGTSIDGLRNINDSYNKYYANEGSSTLNSLVDKWGYQAPTDVSAQSIEAQQIAAQRGIDNSGAYENRYTDNVVNRTLDNFDIGTERSANAFRAGSIAGGQGGNSRQSVAAGVAAGEAARNRAAQEAQMRFMAQDKAFGFGMGDADRFLTADRSNQDANLRADQYNSAQDMAAQQYNQGRLDDRQMFDANMAEQGINRRMGAIQNMENNFFNQGQGYLAQANLGNTAYNQGMGYLDLGTRTFGEQGTEAGKYDSQGRRKTKEMETSGSLGFGG